MKKHVLIVEDDTATRSICSAVLRKQNISMQSASTLKQAAYQLSKTRFDLLILDLCLPDGDGLELVRQQSSNAQLPVLIMTSRDRPEQRFEGFEAGAADYLIKPFHPGELEHRVLLLLKTELAAEGGGAGLITFGRWQLNIAARTLKSDLGEIPELTTGEFDLLTSLLQANGGVVSRLDLLEAITRGESYGHPRTVDVLVSRLRKKLEPEPATPRYILTIPKLGYRLDVME